MPVSANSRLSSWFARGALPGIHPHRNSHNFAGASVTVLVKRCAMSDADAGSLVAAQFAGHFVGALFANRNLRASISIGVPLIAIGVGAFAFSPCNFSYLCTACYGVGLGLTISAINLIIASRQSERRAYSLTLLNFLWGIGAVSSPLLVEWARRHQFLPSSLLGLGAAGFALWAATLLGGPSPSAEQETRSANRWYSPSLLLFGALFFLYVGVGNVCRIVDCALCHANAASE